MDSISRSEDCRKVAEYYTRNDFSESRCPCTMHRASEFSELVPKSLLQRIILPPRRLTFAGIHFERRAGTHYASEGLRVPP